MVLLCNYIHKMQCWSSSIVINNVYWLIIIGISQMANNDYNIAITHPAVTARYSNDNARIMAHTIVSCL